MYRYLFLDIILALLVLYFEVPKQLDRRHVENDQKHVSTANTHLASASSKPNSFNLSFFRMLGDSFYFVCAKRNTLIRLCRYGNWPNYFLLVYALSYVNLNLVQVYAGSVLGYIYTM